eukprot:scaffold9369_cov62-Phaeocystis_antarctica.AAC.2
MSEPFFVHLKPSLSITLRARSPLGALISAKLIKFLSTRLPLHRRKTICATGPARRDKIFGATAPARLAWSAHPSTRWVAQAFQEPGRGPGREKPGR